METRDTSVAVRQVSTHGYPQQFPFHPSEAFPEYQGKDTAPGNPVYGGVRELLYNLGLDREKFGTADWNPFCTFIKPGMTVFIKPNTVAHNHPKGKDLFSVITHASVLRPILDYACLALQDRGTIIVADCPLYSSNFDKAFERSCIAPLLRWYASKTPVKIEWFDLRINKGRRTWLYGRWARSKIMQDPRGYRFVDLGKNSRFTGVDPSRLRIAVAGYTEMRKHHTDATHEYLFPQSLLDSDVVISLPKLKTHRRTGVTLCLKNYMGIPSMKDCLPHFMTGSPVEGGDQYIHKSNLKRICTRLHDIIQTSPHMPIKFVCAVLKKLLWNAGRLLIFKDSVSEAMWPGNDTLWRTLGDINEIITYADKKGVITPKPQRPQLFLVDGIVGGKATALWRQTLCTAERSSEDSIL